MPNGLKLVCQKVPSRVGCFGVAINAGSRDEAENLHGLAHFVEHTIFKGTAHRSSWHINNRLESIGGELNAYTTKEETLLFANTPAGNTERAFELLYDLIAYCNFPHAEIERERDVVIEEINSYLDNPGDSAFDEFEDRIYAGSGLGHNILGTPESVRMLNSEDCRAFIDRLYRPEDMVLYCADLQLRPKSKSSPSSISGACAIPEAERKGRRYRRQRRSRRPSTATDIRHTPL